MSNKNHRVYLPDTRIEIIQPGLSRQGFRIAMFDFDGTVSLIREGWQHIMASMMVEILLDTPQPEDEDALYRQMQAYVTRSTGQPTINQMAYLATEVERRGGRPQPPPAYKQQYVRRLNDKIKTRLDGLNTGQTRLDNLVVPGVIDFLAELHRRGITCYLASGTDEEYVIYEAGILGVAGYFSGGIFGARDDGRTVTKNALIHKILHGHHLSPAQLAVFGDGNDEIEHAARAGCLAVGVASNESERQGVNEVKRQQLVRAGAAVIIPDFREYRRLLPYLGL